MSAHQIITNAWKVALTTLAGTTAWPVTPNVWTIKKTQRPPMLSPNTRHWRPVAVKHTPPVAQKDKPFTMNVLKTVRATIRLAKTHVIQPQTTLTTVAKRIRVLRNTKPAASNNQHPLHRTSPQRSVSRQPLGAHFFCISVIVFQRHIRHASNLVRAHKYARGLVYRGRAELELYLPLLRQKPFRAAHLLRLHGTYQVPCQCRQRPRFVRDHYQ